MSHRQTDTPHMQLNEFQQLASRTLPEPGQQHWFRGSIVHPDGPTRADAALLQVFANRIDLVHAVFGIAGEAGELIDPVKKSMFYGKPLDEQNIREEAGDLLWYIAGPLCRALGCTLEELCTQVVAKLQKRYPEKYTDEAAVARADKGAPFDEELPPQPYPPKPATVTAGTRLRKLAPWEQQEIRAKYKGQLVDFGDGYFWSDEDKAWLICPELWEPESASPRQVA